MLGLFKSLGAFFRSGSAEKPPVAGSGSPRVGAVPFSSGGGDPLAVAAVYRCVRLLSESVANLPLLYQKKRGGVFEEDTASPLHFLLSVQPDPAFSAFDFWRQAVQNMLLDGNAYIVPVYGAVSMGAERLVLCSRGTVAHDTVNDIYTVSDSASGLSGTFKESDIVHLRYMGAPWDAKRGIGVLAYARLALDIASTGDREARDRFASGGVVRGVISNGGGIRGFGEYQDEQLEKTARNMNGLFRGGEGIVSVPGQVEFKQLSLSSADMQFLESRKFTVREICRFFGVHPSFVFDDTSNNYKSAELANVAFLSNTLNPLLRGIETELHRKLVPRQLYRSRRFRFDRRELYACDLDSRARYQSQTIASGLYTVNEWRAEENRPPVEGGDRVMVSANLRGIDETTAAPTADKQGQEYIQNGKAEDDGKE